MYLWSFVILINKVNSDFPFWKGSSLKELFLKNIDISMKVVGFFKSQAYATRPKGDNRLHICVISTIGLKETLKSLPW